MRELVGDHVEGRQLRSKFAKSGRTNFAPILKDHLGGALLLLVLDLVEYAEPVVVAVLVRIKIDGPAGNQLIPCLMVALRPLIDDDVGAIEGRRLATLARLDLDNVDPLDGTLTEKLLEDGLHLLPGNGVVNAGDVDRWNGGHLDCWKLLDTYAVEEEKISIFFSIHK